LCLWFCASLIYINNCPKRCNTKQHVYYSACSLHMFRVSTTPIINITQNCNYSLRYCAATSLQRGQAWPSLAKLEGGSCTKIWPVPEAVDTVLCTPDDGCDWHPKHVEWTCRIINSLTPNDPYKGRTAPLTSQRCILYIYSTNIGTYYFKHGIYSPFFSSKCSLFHNSNVFGSRILHILYTGCAKVKKNNLRYTMSLECLTLWRLTTLIGVYHTAILKSCILYIFQQI